MGRLSMTERTFTLLHKIILLSLITILFGCTAIDKSKPSEIIIKDGGVNLSHIKETKILEMGKLK